MIVLNKFQTQPEHGLLCHCAAQSSVDRNAHPTETSKERVAKTLSPCGSRGCQSIEIFPPAYLISN